MTDRLHVARVLANDGDYDASYKIVEEELTLNPENALALVLGAYILEKAKRLPVAYLMARRAAELAPGRPEAWINLGRMADELWLVEEAEKAYRKAEQLGDKKQKALALNNLAALYINLGEFKRAEPICKKVLELEPDSIKGKANLGFCLLARRDWSGWPLYHYCLGSPNRSKIQYADEPEWNGEKGVVAIYGEQGLGDEISFASMIPDAADRAKRVIIDCDPRLKGLFARSFPYAKVYGTRNKKQILWEEQDITPEYSCAMGALGTIFRADGRFPGVAYLTPCHDRLTMWKALWKKPVIGVAWTGGLHHTGKARRESSLDDFLPLFRSLDATFVSLEYKDRTKEIEAFKETHPGIDLRQYPFATLSNDYDDTAALVASLDCVVSVQTAVVHLAGALGIKTHVMVPDKAQWRYGESGDSIPWYNSVKVWRKKKDWPVKQISAELSTRFGYSSVSTQPKLSRITSSLTRSSQELASL